MDATMSTPILRPDLSQSMNKANNIDFNFNANNYLFNREPDFWVFLYNVSTQEFQVSRPPLLRLLRIPGLSDEERREQKQYTLVTKLPQPLLVPKGNVDSSEIDIIPQDVRRFAMDIVNPDNWGFDQDAVIDPRLVVTSIGNNLGAKGVFWSLNGPGATKTAYAQKLSLKEEPTDREVKSAITRMENYYTHLLKQAREVETSAPQELKNILTPEHHLAADYYGEEHSWHGKKSKPMDCPQCGARVKAGIAYHIDASGDLCIIDWERTVKAGKRTRAQAFDATGDPKFAPVPVSTPPTPHGNLKGGVGTIPTE